VLAAELCSSSWVGCLYSESIFLIPRPGGPWLAPPPALLNPSGGCSAAGRSPGTRRGWAACARGQGTMGGVRASADAASGGCAARAWCHEARNGGERGPTAEGRRTRRAPLFDESRQTLEQHGHNRAVQVGTDRCGLEVHLVLHGHRGLLGRLALRRARGAREGRLATCDESCATSQHGWRFLRSRAGVWMRMRGCHLRANRACAHSQPARGWRVSLGVTG